MNTFAKPRRVRQELVVIATTTGNETPMSWRFETPGTYLIGRGEGSDVRLDTHFASGTHGALDFDGTSVVFTDLGSRNGTSLDGKPLPGNRQHVLAPEAVLEIGDTRITARLEAPIPLDARALLELVFTRLIQLDTALARLSSEKGLELLGPSPAWLAHKGGRDVVDALLAEPEPERAERSIDLYFDALATHFATLLPAVEDAVVDLAEDVASREGRRKKTGALDEDEPASWKELLGNRRALHGAILQRLIKTLARRRLAADLHLRPP